MMNRFLPVVVCWCFAVAAGGWASADDKVDYLTQIKPVLAAKCYSCHGVLKQEAELRLETRSLMLQGGESGEVIVPGEADKSLLVERITSEEGDRMPPPEEGGALKAEEIALIRTWIDQGAQSLQEQAPSDPREHWAFKQPVRADVPQVNDTEWALNPIDAFLAAGHQELGLVSVAPAEKHILLRRLYLDLIGLPPTRQQLHAFLKEDSTGAYESVVLDLLDSPQYGERWGRHWMDIWRYSDWYGLGKEVRYSQKHIWRWRDWIIESLNEDKPYNRMVVEMLAGDEVAPTDPGTLRATGFLVRNYFLFNRTTWLDDTVEHTSKAFLGLTMNCAKCHDHKYDPILQTDFYSMRAFFEPHQVRLDPVPGETDLDKDGLPRVFDADPDVPTYLFIRGNAKDPDKSRTIQPSVPGVLAFEGLHITPVSLSAEASNPALQPFVVEDHLREAEQAIESARDDVEMAKQQLAAAEQAASAIATTATREAEAPANSPVTVAEAEAALGIAETTLAAAELRPVALRTAHAADLAKADSSPPEMLPQLVSEAALAARKYEVAKAEKAVARTQQELTAADSETRTNAENELTTAQTNLEKARQQLAQPGEDYTSLRASLRAANGYGEYVAGEESRRGPFANVSTGRRTALANWIASRKNPLTARVAVNHIWLRHFGQPLVESVSDFGLRANKPAQHALLDWLAVEFMENNWSMKHLHRLIVTSRAYQLRSMLLGADESTKKADPQNQYYWRRRPLRMESQAIRDSLLHLAGVLDATVGGPSIAADKEDSVFRRSLYFTHSRDDRGRFVSMFDDADILSCYRRGESIIPQQALALANSKLALAMSRQITARLQQECGDATDEQFITIAFETVLQIQPTAEEAAACREMIEKTRAALAKSNHAQPVVRARENLVHALLNHNDFVTIR